MKTPVLLASLFGGTAVYIALAACGQPGPQSRSRIAGIDASSAIPDAVAQPATSGTRLRARYLVTDDGARSFVGWYDSTRGENCSFALAPDGVTRCMPFITTQVSKLLSGAYGDAACTRRIAQRANSPQSCASSPPLFVYESVGTNCQPAFRFYDWAEPYTGPVYSMINGSCIIGSQAPDEYYVGGEVPASTWAAYAAASEQHD